MTTIYVTRAEETALNKLISFCVDANPRTDNDKDIELVQQLSHKVKMSRYGAKHVKEADNG